MTEPDLFGKHWREQMNKWSKTQLLDHIAELSRQNLSLGLLVQNVARMRRSQKMYFHSRHYEDLANAKSNEKIVDAIVFSDLFSHGAISNKELK